MIPTPIISLATPTAMNPRKGAKAEHERQDREEHRRGAQQQDTQQDFDYTACDVPSMPDPVGAFVPKYSSKAHERITTIPNSTESAR